MSYWLSKRSQRSTERRTQRLPGRGMPFATLALENGRLFRENSAVEPRKGYKDSMTEVFYVDDRYPSDMNNDELCRMSTEHVHKRLSCRRVSHGTTTAHDYTSTQKAPNACRHQPINEQSVLHSPHPVPHTWCNALGG